MQVYDDGDLLTGMYGVPLRFDPDLVRQVGVLTWAISCLGKGWLGLEDYRRAGSTPRLWTVGQCRLRQYRCRSITVHLLST